MTPDEIDAEIAYRREERLSLRIGDKPATLRQWMEAEEEAQKQVAKIAKQEVKDDVS